MNIILLSGGSGTRLWPLSNEVRSKQFLKVFKTQDGSHESMAQRMYRMILEVDEKASVTIATSRNQIVSIRNQLGGNVGISVEPCRRDTFPAIALATAYLRKQGVSENEPVVVCPVDPYVNKDYFEALKKLSDLAEQGNSNLALMGMEASYPSESYGYIIPETKEPISKVKEFKEKPSEAAAKEYLKQGALWNGGVFAYRLGYLLRIAREILGTDDYDELFAAYAEFQKISFDYAVAEKEKNISVIRFGGQWKDLGTWKTLTEAMSEYNSGKAVMDYCDNTHVINELGIPMIVLGMKDAVVAATADGILVSDKNTSSKLKEYVVPNRPMYERREWGEYRVLRHEEHSEGNCTLVKELVIDPGKHISYQTHKYRTEIWTFTEGDGELILDGKTVRIKPGDSVSIRPGNRHAVKGLTELHIIEVQLGEKLDEEDIERLDWNWQ